MGESGSVGVVGVGCGDHVASRVVKLAPLLANVHGTDVLDNVHNRKSDELSLSYHYIRRQLTSSSISFPDISKAIVCGLVTIVCIAMYSVRTKKVASYGKRSQRYVPVSEINRSTFSTSKEESEPLQESRETLDRPSAQSGSFDRRPSFDCKKAQVGLPKEKLITYEAKKSSLMRPPLGLVPSNIPGSPLHRKAATQRKARAASIKGTPTTLRQFSPFVDVDITVVDNTGKKVSQERRVSNTRVRANEIGGREPLRYKRSSPAKRKANIEGSTHVTRPSSIIVISDASDDEDYVPSPHISKSKKSTNGRVTIRAMHSNILLSPDNDIEALQLAPTKSKAKRKVIVDSDSDSGSDNSHQGGIPAGTSFNALNTRQKFPISTLHPTKPLAHQKSSLNKPQHRLPSHSEARPLTPFRLARLSQPSIPFHSPKKNDSPIDDYSMSLDLSIDEELELALKVAKLDLKDLRSSELPKLIGNMTNQTHTTISTKQSRTSETSSLRPCLKKKWTASLRPLLAECGQDGPYDFDEFVETFPFDVIHSSSHPMTAGSTLPSYQKVGEASYSEVYGIGNVVLKIVPLLDGCNASTMPYHPADMPAFSEAKDVLKEIVVTRAMGNICDGFIKMLRAHVVQGPYPPVFLSLWDAYNEHKGSESVRPDCFSDTQSFAIIVLPNGGPDLESFSFDSSHGWRQACSIFWQVVKSLSIAEQFVHFEHRDLHWGQILVRREGSRSSNGTRRGNSFPADEPSFEVQATIIDLGLARIDGGSTVGDDMCWTAFDAETFDGEGDYQYDIYRMMRQHNGDNWRPYKPLTNVMWLHYLADKLINEKRLRPALAGKSTATLPASRSRRREGVVGSAGNREVQAYQSLLAVECYLGQSLAHIAHEIGLKSAKSKPSKAKGRKGQLLVETQDINSASDVLKLGKLRDWTT